ncbi:MAG: HpcH/HpaI aldolase family protein [Verrucomicrobiia bacterium]
MTPAAAVQSELEFAAAIMNSPTLAQRLRAGQTMAGALIASTSPVWPQAVAACGLDFVFLDTEHIPLDRAQLGWMCQTYSRMGLPPLVRVPSPDPFAASMALDAGAGGIIAPYIECAAQVRTMAGAVKFRPVKGERLARRLDGEMFEPALEDYLRRRNVEPLIVNIESVPAIRALDDILAVSELDAVLIGPHDLSCSLGLPEQYDHPEFLRACETILRRARAAGMGAGIHFFGPPEAMARFHSMGANLLIHASDLTLFQRALCSDLQTLRALCGQGKSATAQPAELHI